MQLKQRIVRILIEEIVVDVDESRREIVLLIHWEVAIIPNCASKRGKRANTCAVRVSKRLKWFDTWPAGSLTN